jgi:glycosyltransferase involved in cell wall biosynthesis
MKRILFVALDEFSNINLSLKNQLALHFPTFQIDELELKTRLKRNVPVLIRAVVSVFTEYFNDFITRKKNIREWRKYLYHTPWIYGYFNREIMNFLKEKNYFFIFQTQSVFNSHTSRIPNFIYIDHTNLNNLTYPLIDPHQYLCSSRYIALEREIYEQATGLLVMSANMKKSLVEQYKIEEKKIRLVYAGSNAPVNHVENSLKYSCKNILFVGKDWERKGGPLLAESFKLVKEKVPDATLTVIGCQPRIALSGCEIIGDVPVDKVSDYYNKASVFCLPTKREPFGIVFIEAMLHKLAIVTNSVGATPEFVISDKNGYIVNFNAKEYADVLIDLLLNPEKCEAFGNASYQIALGSYTWDNTGKFIAEFIKETNSN